MREKAHRGFLPLAAVWLMVFVCQAFATAPPAGVLQPQGLETAGIYGLRQIEPQLTGAGVKVAIVCRSITYWDGQPQNDFVPDVGHNCFSGKKINFVSWPDLPREISPHSTAICSILLGEDANAFNSIVGGFFYQGAIPGAEADIYEFWHFVTDKIFCLAKTDADIVTIDAGSQFEDWWTRGIDALAEQSGITVLAGTGNGIAVFDPPLYPGAGANVIAVGVIDCVNTPEAATKLSNFGLANPEHSSCGPTADGRCKPDIVAPGNCIAADVTEPNRYEPTGNWSSFATPVAAGVTGLLMQKARQDPNLSAAAGSQGANCVIKAILLNSAVKLPYWHKGRLTGEDDHSVPLDYLQGAGMVNAVRAYRQLVAGKRNPGDVPARGWDKNSLGSKNAENVYKFHIAQPSEVNFIGATLVWNRHYRNEYPFDRLTDRDTDLRLELWAVDENDPNRDYLLDYSDSAVDNVEHIYCRQDPDYTTYTLVVLYGENTDFSPRAAEQQYAVAWDGTGLDESGGRPQKDFDLFWYDLNADGIVSEADFAVLVDNLLKSRQDDDDYVIGDIDANGEIDANDLQILIQHKSRTTDRAPGGR